MDIKIRKNNIDSIYKNAKENKLLNKITFNKNQNIFYYALIDKKLFVNILGTKFFNTKEELLNHIISSIHYYKWELSDYPSLYNDGNTDIDMKDVYKQLIETNRIEIYEIKL